MFSPGADSGRDGSGASRPVLIPMRFVWAYGGRSVYVSGSFRRWSENIPMSPMEGCPTVFQVVCNLTPGYHQYKFIVDGEWRHDELQPFVSGTNGIVNTVFLARESDMTPTILPQAPGRSNMGLNDAYLRPDTTPRISDADLKVSRQRISVFLSGQTAYELLPESGKVMALDINLPVKQAFHLLYEQGIPMAPLWDLCKCQFVGVLSALDFILILRELGNHGSSLTEEELGMHTIAAWKEGKVQLNRKIDDCERAVPSHLISAGPDDSLKDVALKILQNNVSTVPIIHSSGQDGSFPQLLHLACLSGILKSDVSSIPIVDDNDLLLDIYSRSDITALAKDKAYAQIRLDEVTIHQVLQLGQDANSPSGFFNGQKRCQMCLSSDPLQKVMERLANPGVRRLVIVEAGSKRVQGIISLSDVFWFLLAT
ncbi:sucrose nonfermenting 4-like protein isoform X2 [Tripterygium wilfordii]|uniref:sucrose nonfermenting 4-like protein isoform X2 n=1 Tax=Tripterygium wilfordii TaxID=458696 RepID=UPI0018F7F4AF|nr:sucrose nonfermenting 4-like protein isoform X2 [Tripterygium wilfordii]